MSKINKDRHINLDIIIQKTKIYRIYINLIKVKRQYKFLNNKSKKNMFNNGYFKIMKKINILKNKIYRVNLIVTCKNFKF